MRVSSIVLIVALVAVLAVCVSAEQPAGLTSGSSLFHGARRLGARLGSSKPAVPKYTGPSKQKTPGKTTSSKKTTTPPKTNAPKANSGKKTTTPKSNSANSSKKTTQTPAPKTNTNNASGPKVGNTGANAILSQYAPQYQKGINGAREDRTRLLAYKGIITKTARANSVPPAIVAGIMSRESRGGAALRNGLGDNGNGFGLMQVDRRHHTPRGAWNSEAHVNQGVQILAKYRGEVARKHPKWTPAQQLRGAISAYNFGVSNVQTLAGVDSGTTGNDYSRDVWQRAITLAADFP